MPTICTRILLVSVLFTMENCWRLCQLWASARETNLLPLPIFLTVDAINLHQDLCLDPPGGFVLPSLPPRGAQAVNLIYEDGGGCHGTSHLKQASHHALAFSPVIHSQHLHVTLLPWNVALHGCQARRTGRPYTDAQDRLLWKDKTCPART